MATVFDRGNLRLYLNGQRQSVHQRRVGTPFSVVDAHRGTAVLGARSRTDVWQSGSTEDNFDGLIDDVRVYDVALSDAEITLLTVVSPHAAARSTDP